jgi:hypothetical protein
MDAEGKQIWGALCRVGAATEEDRAEAAEQRAQADEEKAEAERNISESDQLKEAGSPRPSQKTARGWRNLERRLSKAVGWDNPQYGEYTIFLSQPGDNGEAADGEYILVDADDIKARGDTVEAYDYQDRKESVSKSLVQKALRGRKVANAQRVAAKKGMESQDIRAALGFPKEAASPGQAVNFVHNLVVQKQNAENPATGYGMSEEEDEESSDKKAYGSRWREHYEDYDGPSAPTCSEQGSDWDDMNSEAVQTASRYGKQFIQMVKSMGWKVTDDDFDKFGDDLEEVTGQDWAFEFGAFTVNGKGGQKMLLPQGKSIVLDRKVSEDISLWAAFDTHDVEFEVGSGKYDGDGWNEPREEVMYYPQIECPNTDKLAAIGFSYDMPNEPDYWFAPNQLNKMLEQFGRTFPREFKIRSKVKKRGEDMVSKEGQAIRSALGFPKEAGGETEEWIVDRIRVLENAPWSMLTMSEAHQVKKDIKRLKAELRAARRKAGANLKVKALGRSASESKRIRAALGFPKTGGDDEEEAIRNIIYYLAEKAELPAVDFMESGNDEWRVVFDWKDSWDSAKDEWEALAEDAGKNVPPNWKDKQQREFDDLLEDALDAFQRYKIDGETHRGDLLLETESLAAFANNPRSRSMRACAGLAHSKEAGRLNLGRVVQTRGVSSKARENRAFGKEVQDAFRKYQRGDWGDTERDSAKRNNAVVKDGVEDQVFAVYDTSEGKMYIITEWDGSVTTMLFSHEY